MNQTTIFNNPNLESQQVREELPNKMNQITLDDCANIEQALNSLKFSHPLSTSRKSDKEVSVNNLPSNSLNNLPIQSIKMTNLPTNQQVSIRDALAIVPYFDGSSKIPLTIFIEACKEAKEIVLNAEANLVTLLRSKLTGEARRCIIGNDYNNLEDFISKLKTIFAPSKTVYQLQGDLGRIYMWENHQVLITRSTPHHTGPTKHRALSYGQSDLALESMGRPYQVKAMIFSASGSRNKSIFRPP